MFDFFDTWVLLWPLLSRRLPQWDATPAIRVLIVDSAVAAAGGFLVLSSIPAPSSPHPALLTAVVLVFPIFTWCPALLQQHSLRLLFLSSAQLPVVLVLVKMSEVTDIDWNDLPRASQHSWLVAGVPMTLPPWRHGFGLFFYVVVVTRTLRRLSLLAWWQRCIAYHHHR